MDDVRRNPNSLQKEEIPQVKTPRKTERPSSENKANYHLHVCGTKR